MSLSFSRSERSLQKDDYRTPALLSLLTLPLFIAGLLWFLMGSLPVYAISHQLTADSQGTLIATFTLDDPPNVRRGDSLRLRLQQSEDEALTLIPAVVTSVAQQQDGSYQISLLPDKERFVTPSGTELTGQVEIEVGEQSPFTAVFNPTQP